MSGKRKSVAETMRHQAGEQYQPEQEQGTSRIILCSMIFAQSLFGWRLKIKSRQLDYRIIRERLGDQCALHSRSVRNIWLAVSDFPIDERQHDGLAEKARGNNTVVAL